MEWSNELTLEFIGLYETEPIIWDPKNPQHKNRNLVADAWRRISKSMSKQVSVIELKKKKDSLMSIFRPLCLKERASLKSGAGADDVYKPNWFAYKAMATFLRSIYQPRGTINTENDSTDNGSDLDESAVTKKRFVAPKKVTERSEPPAKRIRLNEARNILSDLRRVTDGIPQQSSDEFEIYGTYVASQLRQLSLEQGIIAREKIHSILTQSRLYDLRNVQSNRFASPDNSSVVENASIYSNSEDLNMSHQLTSPASPLFEKKPVVLRFPSPTPSTSHCS